jgi:molecular chaperone DnaK (HSP70)
MTFESKLGEEWLVLSPPVLNRERPPALRLNIRHQGEAGAFPISAEQIQCSVPWIGFDTSKLTGQRLQAGDSVQLVVNRLKVPGKEDTSQEAKLVLKASASGNASHVVVDQVNLSFVPSPQFRLELDSNEVILKSKEAPFLLGTLYLERGRVWLESKPKLVGSWAELELLDDDPDRKLIFPLELDGRERPQLRFRVTFSSEHLQDIRSLGSQNPTALKRNNKMLISCRDRGARFRSPTADSMEGMVVGEGHTTITSRDDYRVEIPMPMSFILAPEVYLDSFPPLERRQWSVVSDSAVSHRWEFCVRNGIQQTHEKATSAGRMPLQIRQVLVKVRETPGQPSLASAFRFDFPKTLPWTLLATDEILYSLVFEPRLIQGDVQAASSLSATLEITIVSNDPQPNIFYLEFEAKRSSYFPGWLTIDLGTTNTCASLVDSNRQIQPVYFEESDKPSSLSLPSALCYLKLLQSKEIEFGQRALERSREPASTRAVVLSAKRRLGLPQPFRVVPLDEPAETLDRTALEAVSDLYRKVIDSASAALLKQGRSDHVIRRLTLTHPSRFSVHQIGQLTQAAELALAEHWTSCLLEATPDSKPLYLVHEPVGASLQFLNDWAQQAALFERLGADQNLSYSLLVYDFGGGTLDMTLMKVDVERHPLVQARPSAAPSKLRKDDPEGSTPEHGYSYVVTPQLLGALGERNFGGNDITELCVKLTLAEFERIGHRIQWPEGPQPSENARRNASLLQAWCEQWKILLCENSLLPQEQAQIRESDLLLSLPSLYGQAAGEDAVSLISSRSLRKVAQFPTLENIQEGISSKLVDSANRCNELCAKNGIEEPTVSLLVGQSCQVPSVASTLREAFPGSQQILSSQLKTCVTSGAATLIFPGSQGGVQLARGLDRPGVRIKLPKSFSLQATTSRLGIQVVDANGCWFHELIGEGLVLSEQGLEGDLSGLVLEAGTNRISICENAGSCDEFLNNSPASGAFEPGQNPLETLLEAEFQVAGDPGEVFEDCVIHFHLDYNKNLQVTVMVSSEPVQTIQVAELGAERFGQVY